LSEKTLKIARAKRLSKVNFEVCDAYALKELEGDFNAGCANFWFSHIPKDRIEEFIRAFHHRLGKGAVVFMADNLFVEGVGGRLIRKEGDPNTYKIRELSDGSAHEILKNYYGKEELIRIFGERPTVSPSI